MRFIAGMLFVLLNILFPYLCHQRDLEYLLGLLKKGTINPVVRDRLALGKVAKAQALLEDKRIQGYLVCEPWIKSKSRAVYL
jgi:D-arabinose 1-dehydrogenase-like Zn-dependent alcohol dehydrogenase